MRHTMSCIVKNQPGVLEKLAHALGSRGLNIHSLSVNESDEDNLSRVTIVIDGEREQLASVAIDISELDVVAGVEDLDRSGYLDRELVLIKVKAQPEDLPRLMQILEVMHATVIAMGHDNMTIEMSGTEEKISGFIRLLKPFGILEYARSGRVAVSAGGAK